MPGVIVTGFYATLTVVSILAMRSIKREDALAMRRRLAKLLRDEGGDYSIDPMGFGLSPQHKGIVRW
jgi:hypothetical protein